MDTEKVILRVNINGELLGRYNNVKHAAKTVGGHFQCVYNAIWTKILYKESYWYYGLIKKEIETIKCKEDTKQETSCLKCGRTFLTRNKKINHVCPDCNIVNDNIWDNTITYKAHCSV